MQQASRSRKSTFRAEGFCSILTKLADGSMVEVATVGREGMLGVSAILDARGPELGVTMVQAAIPVCYRMPIRAFRREFDRRGSFHTLLTRYAVAHMGFVMQSTACNARHSVDQRLARWLLTAHDRVGQDEFPLTQEFAAMMLGASRPTVTIAAGARQRAVSSPTVGGLSASSTAQGWKRRPVSAIA